MTYEDAWQELRESITELRDNDGTGTQQEICKFLANLMGVLDKQITDGWILCSDGTPKKTGYYICTCHDGVRNKTTVLKWSNGWSLTGSRSYWKVIAWRSLPKEYNAEMRCEE